MDTKPILGRRRFTQELSLRVAFWHRRVKRESAQPCCLLGQNDKNTSEMPVSSRLPLTLSRPLNYKVVALSKCGSTTAGSRSSGPKSKAASYPPPMMPES
jgi:hypothetical protein